MFLFQRIKYNEHTSDSVGLMTHKRTQRIDNSENADNANTKREMHKGSKNQKLVYAPRRCLIIILK